jgi:hypothetical protein
MTTLSNEYSKLLHYLDNQNIQKGGRKVVRKKPPPKKQEQPKKEVKVKSEESKKREEAKKIIEESKIHAYVPDFSTKRSKPIKRRTSAGFDVKQFENMMRSKLIDEHKKLQSYERPYISVTELSSCLRQSYYIRMRYPVNLNDLYRFAYLYLIQKVGNEIHKVVQDLYNFGEIEKTIVSEVYKVKGRLDGIKESFLYEIKSIDADKFDNRYIQEHFEQANIYAYILNTEYDYNIKTVVIIYVIRNLKNIIPFDIPIDDSLAKSLLERAPLLKSSLNNNEVPDPVGAKMEQCKYCLHKEYCNKDECKQIFQPFAKPKKVKKQKQDEDDKKSVFLL